MRARVVAGLVVGAVLAWCAPVQAAGWLPAEEVLPPSSIPATIDQPAVAMTPAGDVLVTWTATGQADQHAVFHRVRKGFTGFGDFSPPALGDHPVVATDSGGRIWIAFHDAANGEIVLARSSHTDPEAFTGVDHFAVPSAPVDLDLAVAPDDAVLTYVIGGQVKLRRWSAGITKDETMYDGAMNPAQDAAVTLDGTGNVMTAFTITPNIEARCPLKARRIPAGQAPAATQDLGDTGVEPAGCQSTNNVELTLGPSGRVMASWYQNVPTTIHAVVAAPGANFSPALPIADDTGPTPLIGNPGSHTYGLLGASDAMLHTYIVRPGTFVHEAQRFRAGGAASALVSTFEISNRPAPLARNASEQAAGAWLGFTPGCQLTGAVGTVGSGLGGAQAIGPCGVNDATTSDPAVALDPAGDAAAAWTADGVVELAVYDATPPEVAGVDAAATATVGQPASFSASARDALSATHVDWEFDDGTTATGDAVGHRFAAPGSHRVVAHVRDQADNAVGVERTVVVSDPPREAESGGGSGPGGSGGTAGGGGGTGTGMTDGGHADTGAGLTGDSGGTGPAMALRGSRLRATRNGVVALKVGCPASTAGGCTGTVALQLGATRAPASRSLASRAFNAAPGATATARLKLSRAARKRLVRERKLAVVASVTARDGAGREATSTHAYTLLAPRR